MVRCNLVVGKVAQTILIIEVTSWNYSKYHQIVDYKYNREIGLNLLSEMVTLLGEFILR